MAEKNPLLREGGFDRLYESRSQPVLLFLARRVLDPEVALDLTSEAFAQAFLSRSKFRGQTEAEASAWLYTIARRQLSRYLRKGKAERRAVRALQLEVPALSAEDFNRIEELAELSALRTAVGAALDGISADHRSAIELRVVAELPYPEVATRLGISEEAARARVSRGLRALAEILSPNETKESFS